MKYRNVFFLLLILLVSANLFATELRPYIYISHDHEIGYKIGKNSIGIGNDWDFFSVDGYIANFYHPDSIDINEAGAYFRLRYPLTDDFIVSYGVGFYNSTISSGVQSALTLEYNITNSLIGYTSFQLNGGATFDYENEWLGVGVKWYPFSKQGENKIASINSKEFKVDSTISVTTPYNTHNIPSKSNIESSTQKFIQYAAFNSNLDSSGKQWISNIGRVFKDKNLLILSFSEGNYLLAINCSNEVECYIDDELYKFFGKYKPFINNKSTSEKKLEMTLSDYISSISVF